VTSEVIIDFARGRLKWILITIASLVPHRPQCRQRNRKNKAHRRARSTRYETNDCAQSRTHGAPVQSDIWHEKCGWLSIVSRRRIGIDYNRKIDRPRSNSKSPKYKPSKPLLVNQRLFWTRNGRRLFARRRRPKRRSGRRRRLPFSGLSNPRKSYRLVPTQRRCFVYTSNPVTATRGTSASLVMT